MISQYGVAAGSALITVVHAEDAQPNESLHGQKRKHTLPPTIMTSKHQYRPVGVLSERQAVERGLQYARRSRPWAGGRAGYTNRGGRHGLDAVRERPNDRYRGGRSQHRRDTTMQAPARIVSVSEDIAPSSSTHKRPRPDSEVSGSPVLTTTTTESATPRVTQGSTLHGSTSLSVRQPKRRRFNRPAIHDVGEEIIIGPRSPEASTTRSPEGMVNVQPAPAPRQFVDLTLLDEPGLYEMPRSPQTPPPDYVPSSPLYVIPPTAELLQQYPSNLTFPALPSRREGLSRKHTDTQPEVVPQEPQNEETAAQQKSTTTTRLRSPSPFLLPSLRRKTSQEMINADSPTYSSYHQLARSISPRDGTATPPSPSPKLVTSFLPSLQLPSPSKFLHTISAEFGHEPGPATPSKLLVPDNVKEESLISPSLVTNPGPSRRLVTSGCEFYPMPESCSRADPDYKENRKVFAREKWRHLQGFGFTRRKCTVRDDGLAIEWESPVPVWSDTYLKKTPQVPSLADAIQLSMSENHQSTQSISQAREQKETHSDPHILTRGPMVDNGEDRADPVIEQDNDQDSNPVVEIARPVTPPRRVLSVKKPTYFTVPRHAKTDISSRPKDTTNYTKEESLNIKRKAADSRPMARKGGRLIMSLEQALMASKGRHIKRIKRSQVEGQSGEEEESEDEDEEGDSDEQESDEGEEDEVSDHEVSTKRKRSRSDSAPARKRARVSISRKTEETRPVATTTTTTKPRVVEVIDLTLDDSSDEEVVQKKKPVQQRPPKPVLPPLQIPYVISRKSDTVQVPQAAAMDADGDVEMGSYQHRDETQGEVKKMVFKPNHVPRRKGRSPPVFTNPWEATEQLVQPHVLSGQEQHVPFPTAHEIRQDDVFVSLEGVEAMSRSRGESLYGGIGSRGSLGDAETSGGVDGRGDAVQEVGSGEWEGFAVDEEEGELMYPPSPHVMDAPSPMQEIQKMSDMAPGGGDDVGGFATEPFDHQGGVNFPYTIIEGAVSMMGEIEGLTYPRHGVESSHPDGGVDSGHHRGTGGNNTADGVILASPGAHVKFDEGEIAGGVVGLDTSRSGESGEIPEGIEKVAEQFLERYIALFDSDRERLGEAYADSAQFSCSVVGCQPSTGAVNTNHASELSPTISAVSRALAGNPKISTSPAAIISVLKALGPFQFYLHEDFGVYYDLAPLPRLDGALDAPTMQGGGSDRTEGRYLLSVHAQLYNAANPMDVLDRLAVDQSFLLCRRSGQLGSSTSYAEGGLAAWPLTILSHQMTLRRTPLLSEEKLVELLPWAQDILR